MKLNNYKAHILNCDKLLKLAHWLETGDSIAQRLIAQGLTPRDKVLGRRWLKQRQCNIVSDENFWQSNTTFLYIFTPEQKQALTQIVPYYQLLATHFLPLTDDQETPWIDERKSCGLPVPSWSNYQLSEYWRRLYTHLSYPLFERLS